MNSRNKRSVEGKQTYYVWFSSIENKIQVKLFKQENPWALVKKTIIDYVIGTFKQKNWGELDVETKELSCKWTSVWLITSIAQVKHNKCFSKLN